MPTTATDLIKEALRLFRCIDQTEDPTPTDITNCLATLNHLLRNEQADGACQYLINRVATQLPPGAAGQPYSFIVGTADAGYQVQVDAVAVRAIYMNDINITVNRETRMAPMADVLRTTMPGIITKWSQERQADGSVRVNAWMPPARTSPALIEYGGRLAEMTAGTDIVGLPPEGIHDATLLLGRRVYGSYGVVMGPTDIILADAERVNARWRDWARGQQWLRFVRS